MSKKDKYQSVEFFFPMDLKVYMGGKNLSKLNITKEDIKKAFQNVFDHWEDGREDFHAEVIEHHLTAIAKWAIQSIIYKRAREQYKNQMVAVSPTMNTSKACIVTEQAMKQIEHVSAAFRDCDDESAPSNGPGK